MSEIELQEFDHQHHLDSESSDEDTDHRDGAKVLFIGGDEQQRRHSTSSDDSSDDGDLDDDDDDDDDEPVSLAEQADLVMAIMRPVSITMLIVVMVLYTIDLPENTRTSYVFLLAASEAD
jgi:hypothetical protein